MFTLSGLLKFSKPARVGTETGRVTRRRRCCTLLKYAVLPRAAGRFGADPARLLPARRILCVAALLSALRALAADTPDLGQPVNADNLVNADYVIMPDGTGLPAGSGTAVEGAVLFATQCQACHGENGENGINDRLAGGHGSLSGASPQKTVGSYWPYATTIFDYVRRAMPYQAPGSLADDEVYAVTAFILYINGVVGESQVIDAKTLPAVVMPNRDNFTWAWSP